MSILNIYQVLNLIVCNYYYYYYYNKRHKRRQMTTIEINHLPRCHDYISQHNGSDTKVKNKVITKVNHMINKTAF